MSGMFTPKAQSMPTPSPAAPMPDSNSTAVMEAKRRAQADVMNRAGRSSTILTAPKDRVGDSYANKTLGGAV